MSLFEVEEFEIGSQRRFYGKYRGTVVNNVDPEQRGRIQVIVPDVSTTAITSWALPCLPWGGMQTGVFCVPVIGAGVFLEFEQGDPDYPIWTGCYWGSASEVPASVKEILPGVPGITLQSPTQNVIQINDTPAVGGIVLRSRTGAMISVGDLGITITDGKGATITLALGMVDINNGALTVIPG